MKKRLFAIVAITFAACSSQSSVDASRDSMTQTMDTQRSAVRDSVTVKADSNERQIDSSFQVLKDSIQGVR